ncbi:MAG: hypothetical protein AB4426_18245 [Xenococcaceae cyanobacterium]
MRVWADTFVQSESDHSMSAIASRSQHDSHKVDSTGSFSGSVSLAQTTD